MSLSPLEKSSQLIERALYAEGVLGSFLRVGTQTTLGVAAINLATLGVGAAINHMTDGQVSVFDYFKDNIDMIDRSSSYTLWAAGGLEAIDQIRDLPNIVSNLHNYFLLSPDELPAHRKKFKTMTAIIGTVALGFAMSGNIRSVTHLHDYDTNLVTTQFHQQNNLTTSDVPKPLRTQTLRLIL